MKQNPLLELTHCVAWLDSDLVVQRGAQSLIGTQRVGLSAGPVQGEHPLRPQPLPVRGRGHEALQLAAQCGVEAEGQFGIHPSLRGDREKLVETARVGL